MLLVLTAYVLVTSSGPNKLNSLTAEYGTVVRTCTSYHIRIRTCKIRLNLCNLQTQDGDLTSDPPAYRCSKVCTNQKAEEP